MAIPANETPEQKAERETAELIKKVNDSLKDNPEIKLALAIKTQMDALELKYGKENKTAEDVAALKTEILALSTSITALKEVGVKQEKGFRAKISTWINDNAEKIKAMKAAGSGFIELEIKAAAPMSTGSATNPDGIPELVGVQIAPPTNVNLRAAIVDPLVSHFATGASAYAYTESVPKDGSYAFIGERAVKPLIDFKIVTRYAEPKKVAAHMELSEESVKDIPGLQSIAYDYLKAQHDLKRQSGILFGDGTGDNLKGAFTYGRAFVAGAMANKVVSPNFMDAVNACITDIFTTHNYTDEMPYMANLVLVSPIDFFVELVAAKDGFGRPLYPMASLFNRVTIGNATIIPFENVGLEAGHIFVADMSKYNVTDYVGYTVRIGWINDQFITNSFCIVGESRLHGFVKKLDEQAFLYDDIDTIKDAIDSNVS